MGKSVSTKSSVKVGPKREDNRPPAVRKVDAIRDAALAAIKAAEGSRERVLAAADTARQALDAIQGDDTVESLDARRAEVKRVSEARQALVPSLLAVGEKQADVAKRIGVTQGRVSQINTRETLLSLAKDNGVTLTRSEAEAIALAKPGQPSKAEAIKSLKAGERPAIPAKNGSKDSEAVLPSMAEALAKMVKASGSKMTKVSTDADREAVAAIAADAERLARWAAGLVAAQSKVKRAA